MKKSVNKKVIIRIHILFSIMKSESFFIGDVTFTDRFLS
jgi:hypothetical protein